MSEYCEFAAKIDEFNEVGSEYDASLKGIAVSTTPVARSKLFLVLLVKPFNKPNLCSNVSLFTFVY